MTELMENGQEVEKAGRSEWIQTCFFDADCVQLRVVVIKGRGNLFFTWWWCEKNWDEIQNSFLLRITSIPKSLIFSPISAIFQTYM